MAYKYHWHYENVWLYRAVKIPFTSAFAITVFGNTQPTANDIVSNWSTTYYNTSLAHFTGATISHTGANSRDSIISLSAASLSSTGLNTGTATWAIMWTSNVSPANAVLSSLPSTSFLVVPAGSLSSNSVIRMSSDSVVTSATTTLEDIALSVKLTN